MTKYIHEPAELLRCRQQRWRDREAFGPAPQPAEVLVASRDSVQSLTRATILKDALTKIYPLVFEHVKHNGLTPGGCEMQRLPSQLTGGCHRRRTQRMKQYVIDELREPDFYRLKEHLEQNLESTAMDGIYWVDLPVSLYTEMQDQHTTCQPYYFAIHLDFWQVSFELLIRSRPTLHCPCIAIADARQREYILQYADRLLEGLDIQA
jgi:hypothetical protein